MKRSISTLFAVLAALFIAVAPGATTAFAWPGYVDGRPVQFAPGVPAGYFVWHEDGVGWHMLTTTAVMPRYFTGRITTDGTFRDVRRERTEGVDTVLRVQPDVIIFGFRTDEHVDGLHFRIDGGTHVRFNLEIDGHPIDNDNIYLGHFGVHPADNTFRFAR